MSPGIVRPVAERGQALLTVYSSAHIEGPDSKLGFAKIRDNLWDGERTIVGAVELPQAT